LAEIALPGDAAEPAVDRGHPVQRIVFIIAAILAAGALASLAGWDIRAWFEGLWDTLTSIDTQYVVAAILLVTFKTTATAYAWYTILRYAYPGEVRFRHVYAGYATCVGLNNILPANLGTIVMFVMLTTVIASATFAGMIGGFLVQKIFFTIAAIFVYLYLFLSVAGSFDIKFEWVKANPWATVSLVVGFGVAAGLLVHHFWPTVLKWWNQAKEGGQVLTHPGAYFGKVFLPEFAAWVAGLCVTAVFLAAYAIPVTFHTVMAVTGGGSIANSLAVTPGGAGVQQAFDVAILGGVTDPQTATAYSVAQQLITTAWTLLMGIILMVWVYGWAGGRALLEKSYGEAKEKLAEQQKAKEAKEAAAGTS
jgi:uncharacterized membrane protein YbhN (UPF0104 family)